MVVVGSKEKEKLLGSFTTLRNKFRNISQKTRGRLEGGGGGGSRNISPRNNDGVATLRTYVDLQNESDSTERPGGMEEESCKVSSAGDDIASGGRYQSGNRSDSFGRGIRPTYSRHGMKRSGSDDTISSQSTLVTRTSLLDSYDHPLGIADLINAPSRPTLTQSRVMAHDKYRQQPYYHHQRHSNKDQSKDNKDDDDQRTIEGKIT